MTQQYQKVMTDLKGVLNNGRSYKGEDIGQQFKAILKKLNDNFGQQFSTKFIRALISIEKDKRQKTYRIRYLLKKSGLSTQRQNRYFGGWALQHYRKDVVEYEHTKGFIYNGFPRHLFNEEMKIEDVRKKANDFMSSEDKLNLRNAINKGNGVRVKNVREEKVTNFFKTHEKQTLFFIVGF